MIIHRIHECPSLSCYRLALAAQLRSPTHVPDPADRADEVQTYMCVWHIHTRQPTKTHERQMGGQASTFRCREFSMSPAREDFALPPDATGCRPLSIGRDGNCGCGWLRGGGAYHRRVWPVSAIMMAIINIFPHAAKGCTTILYPATSTSHNPPQKPAELGKSAADTRDTLRGVRTRRSLTLTSPRWIYWLARPVDSNVCCNCGGTSCA